MVNYSSITTVTVAVTAIVSMVMTPAVTAFSMGPINNDPSRPLENRHSRPPPLTQSQNPHTILGFDWLSPPTDFRVIHNAYKRLAKHYHPDVAVGPDATPQEREAASLNFARINEAYEKLKQRKDEEVLEMTVMVNGRKYTQRVTTSDEIRRNNPNRIQYERILEYQKRFPATKHFSDQYNHEPRHNGDFGPRRSLGRP